MAQVFENLLRAFVPLLVAVDAIGLVPIYAGLTAGTDRLLRRRILGQSIVTAMAVSVGFVLFGGPLLDYLGVTTDDFKIAGGILLFVIATLDMVSRHKHDIRMSDGIGVVPLGTPLIAGPAVLTTSLILLQTYGMGVTLTVLVANLLIAGAVLLASDAITRVLRVSGSKAVSKVANLVLAAFAVMMVRQGVLGIVAQLK